MSANARAIQRLQLRFRDIQARLLPTLMTALERTAAQQIDSQFARSVDPDGNAWRPTAKKHQPLRGPTGDLARGFRVERTAEAAFRIATSVYYARMNQGARNMLPQRRRIGRAWARAFQRAAKQALARATGT